MIPADQFAERLTDFIAREVAPEGELVEADTDLLLTGLVDSLGVVMVSDWIQDELSIVIEPVDVVLENFQSVERMVSYAESRGAVDTS